ncbi:TnpV protein [Bacillus cereus]|uniref:TnpV protein n=1 Tax=Bacillus sp. 3P20 TaxID=3079309 RepID=UPI0035C83EE6
MVQYQQQENGTLIPKVEDYPNNNQLGKYGMMAVNHLKKKNYQEYFMKHISGQLMTYGHKVEEQAWNLHEKLTAELLEKNPIPNTENVLERTKHRNQIKMQVEELVKNQLIYN